MTMPRRAPFPHVGGPYDGADMMVDVDEKGTPAEHSIIPDMTSPNMLLNPATQIQSKQLTALYLRETRDGGFVFVYNNQVVNDPNEQFPFAA